jgi:hypothetical protein
MAFSTFNSFHSKTGKSKISSAYNQLIAAIPPWAIYSASSWNSATNSLIDLTPNGRNATTSGVTQGQSIANSNGATASVTYLSGGTSSTIIWPSGSIPLNFTICSLTRYSGANTGRILESSTQNFIHGHYGSHPGVAFYNGTFTTDSSPATGVKLNWTNMCGTNSASISIPDNMSFNGSPVGISNSCSPSIGTLGVNVNGDLSDFQFSQLIIFDKVLTKSQMVVVSNAINTYMTTGILQ